MKMPGRRPLKWTRTRTVARWPAGERMPESFMQAVAATLKPGAVTLLTYAHDPYCPKLSGGACRCDPDLTVRTVEEKA